MKRISEFFRNAAGLVCLLGFATMIMFIVGGILKPFAPIATVLFVVFGTVYAFRGPQGILAVVGLVLYLASWPLVPIVGQGLAVIVWGLGMLFWFGAIIISLEQSRRGRLIPSAS